MSSATPDNSLIADPLASSRAHPSTLEGRLPSPAAPLPGDIRGWERLPAAPMGLAILLLACMWLPQAKQNPRLVATFAGVSAALSIWALLLWVVARSRERLFRVQFVPVKSHYVQACVQFTILLWWGRFWPNVNSEIPLIAAQVAFLYALDALLSWSRGRVWRLGFGPLPIVISTNLLLWFRHDWYFYQFLMLATGALAKQFVTWEREGRRMHIFNPSAFGQFLFALVLIATSTTKELTLGKEIAASFETPHMLVVIFLGGLVVQYLFHVTLMTVAAVATLLIINLVYTQITGVYYFVNINIAAPIFLGVHLLITDPATSPRTPVGKVIFGALYALGYSALFRILDLYEIPLFWDKLLPVPMLNLCVPLIDRMVRAGTIGRCNRAWENLWRAPKLNLVHMTCWAALFATLWTTGFVEGPHPGNSIPFWKTALKNNKPHAGHSLVLAAGNQAEGGGSGAAYNELGLICMEGRIVKQNHATAAKYFDQACELRDESGCVNVAIQFLFLREHRSEEDVTGALDLLEQDCQAGGNSRSCYLAGFAYESGRGRPSSPQRAIELYERAGIDSLYVAKGLARIALSGVAPTFDVRRVVARLAASAGQGDSESCWYLAHMYGAGICLSYDLAKAKDMMARACRAGADKACLALELPDWPTYEHPVMMVPGWATAFPVP